MVTINYINELKNDAYENRLGKITLNDNTILDQDNNLSSLEIDSGCYIDGSIIGSVYVKKATVSLLGSDISLNGKTFNAQVGVKYEDGTTEYTNLGNYKVTELKDAVTENQLSTVAYDYLMDKIDQPYVCGVDFSSGNKTVKDFYTDVCSQLGLTPVTTTFINSTIPVSANPFNEQTTNRIVLQSIGKVACSYITIDQSTNKINLSWLSTSTTPDYEFDVDDYSTFTGGETTFGPVNKVVIKNNQIDSENISMGTGDNEVVISEDYFLYNATLRQQAITAIYNRLKNLTYVNADLTTYHGKPFLNIGDKIRINYEEITDYDETGEPIYENHVYDTYVLTHTLTYDGTLTSKITSPVPTKQEISITNDISLGEALRNTQAIVDKQNNKIEFVTQEVEQMGEKIGTSAISITTEYYLSNSRTSLSGGSWSTTISSVPTDKYLWTRTKTTYQDTTKQPTYSTAVPITGNEGKDGEPGSPGTPGAKGDPGRGVKSIVPQYYLSTSNTTQTGGSWSATQPTWQSGKYIWVRSHITWDDNTTTDTTPQLANFENDIAKKYSDLTIETGQISAKVGTLETNYNKEFTTTGTVDGYPVNITDASATIPKSNIIYGNSVQSGTPTPTAPISVDNVGIENLCNGINMNIWLNNNVNQLGITTGNSGLYIETEGNNYFTISTTDTQTRYRIACTNEIVNNGVASNGKSLDNTKDSYTINTSGYKYLIVNATDLTKIQIEKGTTSHQYVPYGSWLVEKTCGKNLLDVAKVELGYRHNYGLNDGTIPPKSSDVARMTLGLSNAIKVKPNTNYTFKCASGFDFALAQLRKDYGANGDSGWITTQTYTATTKGDTEYIAFNFRSKTNSTISQAEYNTFINGENQLEQSNIATPFEPYKENLIQIDLQGHELCKIGDVKDEYNVNTGILTKRIGKIVLDGSESWTLQSINSYGIANFLYRWASNYPHDEGMISNQISSHFTKQNTIISQTTNMGFLPTYDTNVSQLGAYFRISSTIADTIEKFKNWLSQNKPAVYYTLAEPKEIQLDLNPLELFENTNNITVESSVNPTLHIEYYKNTILNGIYATKGELAVSNREINLSVESSFGDVANQIDDLSGNLNSSISQLTLNESSIQASVTEIEKNLSDNTEKIKNMSSEFTTNGLRISSSQSDFNALFNNVGVQVFDRDKLTAIFNQNGSGVNKLIIVESMQFQNLLAQKREIDLNGTTKPVISFFWNNNLIETLEDLRGGN